LKKKRKVAVAIFSCSEKKIANALGCKARMWQCNQGEEKERKRQFSVAGK